MRILIAADSFKDALSATEACAAIARGLHERHRGAVIVEHPLADGGEGTLEILARHLKLRLIDVLTCDPLRRPLTAQWGLSKDGTTAYVELARASGLQLLANSERSPLHTSTFGTGLLLAAAASRGVNRIVLAIGGSATNDAGVGMLAALGWQFLSAHGAAIEPIGGQLGNIARVLPPAEASLLAVDVLCDVTAPLYGPQGAAHSYARQKGANENEIEILDAGLRHFANCTQLISRRISPDMPGSGAAGGVGFAAAALLNARLHSGIEYLLKETCFDAALDEADLVITGEGRIDAQTLQGKLIHGVCLRAAKRRTPVIALCGKVSATPAQLRDIGLQQAFDINEGHSLHDPLAKTSERLTACATALRL